MPTWSSQRYRFQGERQGIASDVLDAATKINERIREVDPRLPTILTLRHLGAFADVPFNYLNRLVSRSDRHYKRVLFRKKVPGRSRYREIHIPEPSLLKLQQWITHNILKNTIPHDASFAYHPHSQPVFAAARHCGCRWLLKVDIEDFFHRISEGKVFYAFRDLGYPALLSVELARITTMVS
jgi:RNA-directed DNA polymerase